MVEVITADTEIAHKANMEWGAMIFGPSVAQIAAAMAREAAEQAVVEWLEGMAAKCDTAFKASGDHGVGCAREAYRRAISAIAAGQHRKETAGE